jgi:hypothetical protein
LAYSHFPDDNELKFENQALLPDQVEISGLYDERFGGKAGTEIATVCSGTYIGMFSVAVGTAQRRRISTDLSTMRKTKKINQERNKGARRAHGDLVREWLPELQQKYVVNVKLNRRK